MGTTFFEVSIQPLQLAYISIGAGGWILMIIVVIITWLSDKPSQKTQGLWFVKIGYVYAKF